MSTSRAWTASTSSATEPSKVNRKPLIQTPSFFQHVLQQVRGPDSRWFGVLRILRRIHQDGRRSASRSCGSGSHGDLLLLRHRLRPDGPWRDASRGPVLHRGGGAVGRHGDPADGRRSERRLGPGGTDSDRVLHPHGMGHKRVRCDKSGQAAQPGAGGCLEPGPREAMSEKRHDVARVLHHRYPRVASGPQFTRS